MSFKRLTILSTLSFSFNNFFYVAPKCTWCYEFVLFLLKRRAESNTPFPYLWPEKKICTKPKTQSTAVLLGTTSSCLQRDLRLPQQEFNLCHLYVRRMINFCLRYWRSILLSLFFQWRVERIYLSSFRNKR